MVKRKIKIVLTGGHAGSTAYALVQNLKENSRIDFQMFWIGAKTALEGSNKTTFEHKVFNKIGIPFYELNTGRVQRRFTIWTIPSLLKIPIGFLQSFYYLIKIKPNIIFSFGGYAALPVVIAGWLLGIKIIIHEQTSVSGRANEVSSKFANKILLARSTSLTHFPKHKCEVVGNPVSWDIQSIKPKYKLASRPTILVTGGSRGSLLINNIIKKIIPDLLEKYHIIHQTGETDFELMNEFRNSLRGELKDHYEVLSFIEPWYFANLLNKADIVISRAGANTVSDIIYSKRPAILIPLKIAYKDEQMENAKFAKDYGIASLIEEKDLNERRILIEINNTIRDFLKITDFVKNKKSPDEGAAERVVKVIEGII